jgi:hypothetical protein
MARFAVGAVLSLMVGAFYAPDAQASPEDDDAIAAAQEAGVDLEDLRGAVNTVGIPARQYLISVGELAAPIAPYLERLLNCLSWHESRGYPGAYNRYSGASGEFQFLPSTWRTTPQGRAGLSPFDPVAARAATIWMIGQGRLREWVTWGRCA